MPQSHYQDFFINPTLIEQERQAQQELQSLLHSTPSLLENIRPDRKGLYVIGYGFEAQQALKSAVKVIGDFSLEKLHRVACFIEEKLQLSAIEILRCSLEEIDTNGEGQPTLAERAYHLRWQAGDLNLWIQTVDQIDVKDRPATNSEMLAVLALWKGQLHLRMGGGIGEYMVLAAPETDFGHKRSPEVLRRAWAEYVFGLVPQFEQLMEIAGEICRASTLAVAGTSHKQERKLAAQAGAEARAAIYLPQRRRIHALYRSSAYKSRSAAADQIYALLLQEGGALARSTVLKYLKEFDEMEERSAL